MTPKRWMVVAWAAVLAMILGVGALYGGRNCEAPKSGPFHSLLAGHSFVPSKHWRTGGCLEVRSDGTPFPLPVKHGH